MEDADEVPSTATLVTASKRMLEELSQRDMALPDELLRVQDLLESIEHNSQRISTALLENRRRKKPSDYSKSVLPELLREQEQYLQEVRGNRGLYRDLG
jgi:hypothetical protein